MKHIHLNSYYLFKCLYLVEAKWLMTDFEFVCDTFSGQNLFLFLTIWGVFLAFASCSLNRSLSESWSFTTEVL